MWLNMKDYGFDDGYPFYLDSDKIVCVYIEKLLLSEGRRWRLIVSTLVDNGVYSEDFKSEKEAIENAEKLYRTLKEKG